MTKPGSPWSSRSRKVLLVEDNPADARLVQEQLKAPEYPGLVVDHVGRLADALAKLGSDSYVAVLLDLGLPDSNGLSTAIRVLEAFPDVPVVVFTGLEDEKVGLLAVQEGAQDYLVKGQVATPVLRRALEYAVLRRDMISHAEAARAEDEERSRPPS